MSKLSKQDKVEIYHLWHDYQISPAELSQRYRVGNTKMVSFKRGSKIMALANQCHARAIRLMMG